MVTPAPAPAPAPVPVPRPRTRRFVDPKADLAFKRVFAEHKDLLKSFLNALLPLPADGLIDDLEYLTPEQAPEVPGLFKNSIVDVKCRDTQGRTFIVEMQIMWSPSFEQRLVFAGAQAYVKQLKSGEPYRSLQPVYALAILNDIYRKDTDEYYHHFALLDTREAGQTNAATLDAGSHNAAILKTKTPLQTIDLGRTPRKVEGFELVFIELPKFKASNTDERRMRALWLRFLSEIGGETAQVVDDSLQAESNISQALDLVEVGAFTDAELARYHADLDQIRSHRTLMVDSHEEGVIKGWEKGREAGKAEGKAEGELAAKHAIAAALLADGLSIERVATLTGLTAEQLRAL